MNPLDAPWASPVDDVAAALETQVDVGLSGAEAETRLSSTGPNELARVDEAPLWRRVARQFDDPLVLLLLVAIVISVLAWMSDGRPGAPIEAIVIAAIVVVNAALGTWQEGKARQAVASLRQLGGSRTTVVRDGERQVIARSEVVPGDLVLLDQGDAVGADIRLHWQSNLAVSEAALTGESMPVSKSTTPVSETAPLADRSNMVFRGTAVAAGRGSGVVVATGMRSEIGRIARLIDDAEQDATPLQRQIAWLGKSLGAVVVVLALAVVATIMITSEISTFSDVVDALLVGVSLAVAAVPEGLPAILSIVLALGVQRMAADRAIVKRLSSVETLGSASVICSDKTGTLTMNEMSIVTVVSGEVEVDVSAPTMVESVAESTSAIPLVVGAGVIANDASISVDDDGRPIGRGDPTELAFLSLAARLGPARWNRETLARVAEIPFDSERKLMSTLNDNTAGFAGQSSPSIVLTKGAPDVLIERCTGEWVDGSIRPMTPERRVELGRTVDRLAGRSLRTLATAFRPLELRPDSIDPDTVDGDTIEEDLILLGIVGLIDPPRPEVHGAIAAAQSGGIRIIMITGDHPLTAATIARDLNIDRGDCRVVTGAELSRCSDDELDRIVREVNVYARVEPEHKLNLVRSLQRHGAVTAMTGDGVNDAPALKQADIGVAMGRGGTEVSREAADMILADDNFATILTAVREGREIFTDIRKFLRYLLASNTGEVLVVLIGVMFAASIGLDGAGGELAVPLLATQILWINLVTDGALALALGIDPPIDDVMSRPPRPIDERVVDRPMWIMIVLIGCITALVSLLALDLELPGGLIEGTGTLESARTMAFTTLVLSQVVNAFSARSATTSALVGAFVNPLLWLAALVTVVAQVVVVHLPGLSTAFSTTPLSATQWLTCACLAAAVLVPPEAYKFVVRRRSSAERARTFGSGGGVGALA